jgi:thiol-disulfide isomerase/thioredoxin
MKYILITILTISGAIANAQNKFTLSGKVNGASNGILYLSYVNADGKYGTDSARLSNGQFTFTGKLNEPSMAFISLNSKRTNISDSNVVNFFIEPATMTMQMSVNAFKDANVTGSKTQTEYAVLQTQQQKFQKRWKRVLDTLSAINQRSNALYQETKAWALSPYMEEYREVTTTFMDEHPQSYVTAWLLRSEHGMPTDTLKKMYARFPAAVQQSSFGKAIAMELEKRKTGIPGVKAPLFTSEGIDGKPISLENFKGKYVLIDFWASWCVPCRKMNPHLKQLYTRYKDKGFEVIGVSDDDRKPEAWRKAVALDGLPWKHVLRGMKMITNGESTTIDRSRDINEGYNIVSLPTQVLIDPNGMIIGRYGDGLGESHEALDKKLEALFK